MYDLIIIGAGPAGLSAGIYARRANLKTLILEKETIGGQIASSPLVQNYPGYKQISGSELANNFYEQVIDLGADLEIEEVMSIKPGKIKEVVTDCNKYKCKAIILATGAKYRLLGLDNEINLIGSGIHFCTSCDGAFYKNKECAVIGGANSAVVNAIYLANICSKVYLIYRKNKLRCEKSLIDTIQKLDNVEIIYNANVIKINGTTELESIELDNGRILNIPGMFISIGLDANTSLANNLLDKAEDNYIISTDSTTKEEGIFVAGDCIQKALRQVTTAISDGSLAATQAINYINKLEEK